MRAAPHAVITGAGGGIGAATADALSAQGARLTLIGRDLEKLRRTAASIDGAFCATADVSDAGQVRRALDQARERHGPIDILVNNAGVAPSAPFLKVDDAQWRRTLAVNLDGPFFCARDALPDMLAAGWGRIVNVASTAGLKGYAYVAAYCASKHALVGLTRALAQEVARRGVTVNAVCPGFTDTEITEQSISQIVDTTALDAEQARAALTAHNPQARLIAPAEAAAAIAWLCTQGASAVNGATISVSGGEV